MGRLPFGPASAHGGYRISARSLSYRVVHIARLSLLPGELVGVKPLVQAATMLDHAQEMACA
jgi:hypothetical protein